MAKTMRDHAKKYTKAQLLEMHRNMGVEKMAMEHERNEAQNKAAALEERIANHERWQQALTDSNEALEERVRALDILCRRVEEELRDMNTDRDNWRRDYLAMQDAHRKMRENLFQQARLAGVLAMEGKGPFAGHADLSN